MIIKSMSRKAPTFEQLIAYIARDGEGGGNGTFARNLYHGGENTSLVADQFHRNYRYLPKRRNGNALFHEVIVLENQGHLSKPQQAEILTDLAERYCSSRAPDQLAWGRVHFNSDYPHIHMMISSNGVRSHKRVRLDKATFAGVQRQVEGYGFERYPELSGRKVYDRTRTRENIKVTKNEGEMKRRSGEPSDKEKVAKAIGACFHHARDVEDLKSWLAVCGYDYYERGKTAGVKDQETGRKYRLATLGLSNDLDQLRVRSASRGRQKQTPSKDERASSLLNSRTEIEKAANKQLDGFEQEQGSER